MCIQDFNSNDAFPLLAEYRDKFLTYNDDIQGTAAVAVAAVLGGIKIQKPAVTDLIPEMQKMRFLFFGAGSANLGGASLIMQEGGVPASSVIVTNSKVRPPSPPDRRATQERRVGRRALLTVISRHCPRGAFLFGGVRRLRAPALSALPLAAHRASRTARRSPRAVHLAPHARE